LASPGHPKLDLQYNSWQKESSPSVYIFN
jgi:hypothetical protein